MVTQRKITDFQLDKKSREMDHLHGNASLNSNAILYCQEENKPQLEEKKKGEKKNTGDASALKGDGNHNLPIFIPSSKWGGGASLSHARLL